VSVFSRVHFGYLLLGCFMIESSSEINGFSLIQARQVRLAQFEPASSLVWVRWALPARSFFSEFGFEHVFQLKLPPRRHTNRVEQRTTL
jgi:hypothetical protein